MVTEAQAAHNARRATEAQATPEQAPEDQADQAEGVNAMSRSTRRRQPFWSVLLNLCWPTWALWLLLAATQAGSLNYL